MKIKSVNYSITFELPVEFGIERWRKIGLEVEPDKTEVAEQVLDAVDKQIKTWHEKKFPELYGKAKPKILPVINTSADYVNEDEEWDRVKGTLRQFKFREDAQLYLDTTQYKLTLEAKKLVNNKPSKNEKK
jgi:hypothetical protein